MTFGFHSPVDLLSWIIVLLLGVKVAATIILLARDRRTWFSSRWGPMLWWSTKVTPLVAVPCMIAIALRQNDIVSAWVYTGLMAFVVVAVSIVVWNRFYRSSLDRLRA